MAHISLEAQDWEQQKLQRQSPELFPQLPEKRLLPTAEQLGQLKELLLLQVNGVKITIQAGETSSIRVDDWHGSVKECFMMNGGLLIKGDQRPDAQRPTLSISGQKASVQATNLNIGGIHIGNLQAENVTQVAAPENITLSDLKRLLRGEEDIEKTPAATPPTENGKKAIEINVGTVDQSSDHVYLTLPPGHTFTLQRGAEKFNLRV